ncbi:MAG: DUF87 domain-containing protein [Desulfurococcaceae archaeon]
MRFLDKFLSAVNTASLSVFAGRISRVEIEPPDLIIYISDNKIVLNRFLIFKDADYNASDLSENSLRTLMESYVALLNSLPSGVHLYLVKEEIDTSHLIKKLTNEILNTQVDLESSIEESTRIKLNIRLSKLRNMYDMILNGKPFIKISLVVVYRVKSHDKGIAKNIADYYETIIHSTFRNTYGLNLERATYSDIIQAVLSMLGLIEKPSINTVEVDAYRIAHMQPLILSKPPSFDKTIVIGFDKYTQHPVEVAIEEFFKHTAIIGPTGRGKTTLLAGILEQALSEDVVSVIALDFKGDIKRYLENKLINLITPREAPLSILIKPPAIDPADWKIMIVEALSRAGNLLSDSVLRALNIIEKEGESGVLVNPQASILIPFVELLSKNSRVDVLIDHLLKGRVLIDVEGYGVSYQNAYIGLCIGLSRYILLRENERGSGVLLAIDDAWRVLGLKTLVEIVREGRSRRLGVVLSTQNPEDIPGEVLENIYYIVVFGSRNGDYVDKTTRIFNLKEEHATLLPKLGVGEAVFVSTSRREAKVIKTYTPVSFKPSNFTR